MRRRFLVALIAVAVIVIALAYGVQIATPPTPSPTPEVTPTVPAPTPTRPLSFEEALAAARNPKPSERWSGLEEYRGINDYRQPPYKAADGSTGHYLYHAADGTLYEATYPSGEIGIPIARVVVPKDKEAYYIWEIRADLKQSFVDARTGEVLYVLPLMPPFAPVSVEYSNRSYGFNEMNLKEGYFVLSRRRPATLIIILTSTADRTLHLTPSVEDLPAGVTAEFDSEFITLEPNKPFIVKLTLTASPDAASEIPCNYVSLNFTLQEEGYRFKMLHYYFCLTIGL